MLLHVCLLRVKLFDDTYKVIIYSAGSVAKWPINATTKLQIMTFYTTLFFKLCGNSSGTFPETWKCPCSQSELHKELNWPIKEPRLQLHAKSLGWTGSITQHQRLIDASVGEREQNKQKPCSSRIKSLFLFIVGSQKPSTAWVKTEQT